MARPLVVGIVLVVLVASAAAAAETQLGGIRLGQPALELLDLKPYGPPPFFGPLGAVTTYGLRSPSAPAQATAVGPSPSGQGIMPAAVPPGLTGQGGLAAEEAESSRFWMQLGIVPGAPTPAAPTPAAPRAPTAAGTGAQIYWLYNLAGGVQMMVGIDGNGRVTSLLLTGKTYAGAKTACGVRLGDTYMSVLDKYGFPDSQSGSGGNLVLTYAGAGLTFTFTDLRVTSIALGKAPQATAPPATVVSAPSAPARPAVSGLPPFSDLLLGRGGDEEEEFRRTGR